MPPKIIPLAERLSKLTSRNEETGCLFYTGHIDKYGYGQISVNGKTKTTHKVAWELANGAVPEGLCVCHSCDIKFPAGSKDNRKCCEVSHLYLATARENTERTKTVGRHIVSSGAFKKGDCAGEKNRRSILTKAQVDEIRQRKANGLNYGELKCMAEEYGISYPTIQAIVSGRLWKE
jgi:hypothetical protein